MPVTCHVATFFLLSGEASHGRVGYQRRLPRLVNICCNYDAGLLIDLVKSGLRPDYNTTLCLLILVPVCTKWNLTLS